VSVVAVGVQYVGGAFGLKTFARRAEAAGFDSVWCGDHVSAHVDGIAGLGVLAGCTERITIGTSVLVMPFRPVVISAKGLLSAAEAAGGRAIAGVGVGGELPLELAATGADQSTRGAFLDEAIEVLRLLWSGGRATFRGRWTNFDGLSMEPVFDPPPIWIGGRSTAAVRRAARVGSGYMPYLVTPDQVRRRAKELRAHGEEIGLPWTGTVAAVTFVVNGRDAESALETAMASPVVPNLSAEQIRARYLLGTPDDIIEQANAYVMAGVDHLILGFPPGDAQQLSEFLSAGAGVAEQLAGKNQL
jgi:alkanesulfonate monooxygenase SsuD/methylene tetrahydromethanopterin reductase-like flavin-dependent oxidoreductase (luciferase family)